VIRGYRRGRRKNCEYDIEREEATGLAQARQPTGRSVAALRAGDRTHAPALGAGPQERPDAHIPVSPLSVGGRRYAVAVFEGAQWVENARAAGWGVLSRGRRHERVGLVELPCAGRAQVLREVPREVPQAARFLRQRYGIPDEPAAFAALAPRCTVFRIHSIPAEDPARAANEDTSSQTCKEKRNLTPPEEAAEG